MKNTSVSLFRQVLDLIPKREFEEIVMKHNGDKRKQSFDSWAHFVSMIFCQLAQANSLRDIQDCGSYPPSHSRKMRPDPDGSSPPATGGSAGNIRYMRFLFAWDHLLC